MEKVYKYYLLILIGIISIFQIHGYASEIPNGESCVIKFLSGTSSVENSKYVTAKEGLLKCSSGIVIGSFWQVQITDKQETYCLYNPVSETYVCCKDEDSFMILSSDSDDSSLLKLIPIDDEMGGCIIKLVKTDKYIGVDDINESECQLYGNKNYEEALRLGRFKFEDLHFTNELGDLPMEESGINPAYFNLQGMPIEKPESGIYIERRNGRSIKHLK